MTDSITTIRKSRYSVEAGNDIHTFTVGAFYFGNLTCSHGEHKMACVKRTAKSVWLAPVIPALVTQDGTIHRGESWELPRRSKVQWEEYGGKVQETTNSQGWFVDADGRDSSSAPNTY